MNERLKQACAEFARSEEYLIADTYGKGYETVAMHFYNLALEDVRKWTERQNCDRKQIQPIFELIDNLTK